MSSKITPKIQHTDPMGADGVIRCKHGEEVTKVVSNTPKNPGRYVLVSPALQRPLIRYTANSTSAAGQNQSNASFGVSTLSSLFFQADVTSPIRLGR